MNILLIDSTYRYLRLVSTFNSEAKRIVSQVSGVEPALFVARPLVDWHDLDFRHFALKGFLRFYKINLIPLSNHQHGIRMHGLMDFAFFKSNQVHYTRSFDASVALLSEQIDLANQLAAIAKVDDTKYPSIFTIHLGQKLVDKKVELKIIIRALKEVLPLAKEKKVIINLENVWSFDQRNYALGSDLEDLVEVIEQVGDHPNLGITFDFAHAMIHYRGDREKIYKLLDKYGLFKKIYHLHLTTPAADYRQYLDQESRAFDLPWWRLWSLILFRNPDNQGGFKEYFQKQQVEVEQHLSWMKKIINKTPVIDKKYNCATLELSFKIPGTNSGAKIDDIAYSLAVMKEMFEG